MNLADWPKMGTLALIDRLEIELEEARRKALEKRGWSIHCMNPASFWLWEKNINGTIYRGVTTENALQIEKNLPPWEDE